MRNLMRSLMHKVKVLSGKKIELIHAVFESKYYELIPDEGPYFSCLFPGFTAEPSKKTSVNFQREFS